MTVARVDLCKMEYFCPEQEHTDGSFLWEKEVSFGKPEPRRWSLTSGSMKSSRGHMGHGEELSSIMLNCELLL